jgi:hypothetical protein
VNPGRPAVDSQYEMRPTNPPRCRFALAGTAALAFLLLPALAATAETFLVTVTETDDGQPTAPPLAAREGVFAALFDGEHIGFEVPADRPALPVQDLKLLAREAGADVVAVVAVDWHQERLSGGLLRVSARGSIVFVDALTEHETASVPFSVGNEGRERVADRSRLGVEIGSALVEAFRSSTAGP